MNGTMSVIIKNDADSRSQIKIREKFAYHTSDFLSVDKVSRSHQRTNLYKKMHS